MIHLLFFILSISSLTMNGMDGFEKYLRPADNQNQSVENKRNAIMELKEGVEKGDLSACLQANGIIWGVKKMLSNNIGSGEEIEALRAFLSEQIVLNIINAIELYQERNPNLKSCFDLEKKYSSEEE